MYIIALGLIGIGVLLFNYPVRPLDFLFIAAGIVLFIIAILAQTKRAKLSHLGGWVAETVRIDNSVVVGCNACVYQECTITGNVQILDNAEVFGQAILKDNVVVRDQACVGGAVLAEDEVLLGGYSHSDAFAHFQKNSRVDGHAIIAGNAQVGDEAVVSDYAKIEGGRIGATSVVKNYARITGNPRLYGTVVSDNAEIHDNAILINSELRGNSISKMDSVLIQSVVEGNSEISGSTVLQNTKARDKKFLGTFHIIDKDLTVEEITSSGLDKEQRVNAEKVREAVKSALNNLRTISTPSAGPKSSQDSHSISL
jgi:carbonic anhydrase/acetyltransferase-like protein (isoleucine patch superfamily)